MKPIRTTYHPDTPSHLINNNAQLSILTRHAARAIVINGDRILLVYTSRYDDYSLPGGGIDQGEDKHQGLIRELNEETGATGVRNIREFARYDEYRPWHKPNADLVHMISHCYCCEIDQTLGQTSLEDYEVRNGMKALWVNLEQAIAHNEGVIQSSPKKGLSIERETFLFKLILEKLVDSQYSHHSQA
jgi:8-oxo-dGTP pyrophosphatase MutT (NUDIX family)